ncbi:MAG: hypothetical protein M1823_005097 [Watsoniomyces obsoletus]|nr:MAG: hypothetical protein M1823_005097 [Watsoniomyces obsoletus]
MKLDVKAMRYLAPEDWRVLTAVEMGSRNHEIVPTPLITQIAGLRGGSGVHKCISMLAKNNLISRVKNAKYDGYRLTYGGMDYLSLHAHMKSSSIYSVGNQIGVGKESDIFVVAAPSGAQLVLKIHRLGRISFRTVKANRDYLRNRNTGSWMYLSRLAASKEFIFMKALKENGFPVPQPIAQNRHTVLMELIDAFPLRQISSVPDPAGLYEELIAMILRLASFGLIHGDFNEFNILIKEEPLDEEVVTGEDMSKVRNDEEEPSSTPKIKLVPILIDFPQMVSIDHVNAEMYFDRDVQCIKRYFERRYRFTSSEPGPFFSDALKQAKKAQHKRLDVEAQASGFSKKMMKEFEAYMGEALKENENEGGEDEEEEIDDDGEAPGTGSDDQEGDDRENEVEEERSLR